MQLSREQDLEYKRLLDIERPCKPFTKESPYQVGEQVYLLKSYNCDSEIRTIDDEISTIKDIGYLCSGFDFYILRYLVETKTDIREEQTPYAIYLKSILDKVLNQDKQEKKRYTIFDFI